jgi:hypothetical protein
MKTLTKEKLLQTNAKNNMKPELQIMISTSAASLLATNMKKVTQP